MAAVFRRAVALTALALSRCASSSSPAPAAQPVPCTAVGVPGTCRADCGRYDAGAGGVCSGGLLCCTPATAVACDSSAMPLPALGGEDGATPGCPPSMRRVDAFCIDRYEATVVAVGSDEPWSPYWNPGSTPVRARSATGSVPQGYLDQLQAAAACAAAGKRLCTDSEWLRACQGPAGTTYPYGDVYAAGACNDQRSVHPAVELFGTTEAWIWSYLDHPCLDQLPASLDRTAARRGCVTAEGVYDMVGNLAEWTSDPAGTLRGGDYASPSPGLNGSGCLSVVTAHAASFHDFATGFRCCADGL